MIKTAPIIRKSNSWNDLFEKCESLPNKDKGDIYEHVVQLYLQTHSEYRTKLSNVWLLNEVPPKVRRKLNLPARDEGIDLIAETRDGKYWAIQAKFRSDIKSRLTMKGDISTFTSLAFHTCENIEFALICATTSQPMAKVKLTGDNVGFRLYADFAALDDNDCEGWNLLQSGLGKAPKPPKKLKPRPHQKRAVKNAKDHFVSGGNARGKMIMPCGTGKSLTGFWIAQALDAKTVVVAVPSLALVKQTLNVWTQEYLAHGITPEWISICSDNDTGNIDGDVFTAHTYDLGVPCTTDVDEITTFLNKRSKSVKVIFTTYQSGRVLSKAAKKAKKLFDFGIMDEAHKTVGRKDKVFSHLLSDRNIKIKKRVFMTATERLYKGSSDQIISMDDVKVYGTTFELLTFKEAIEADPQIICDYRFVTIGITEREIKELWEDNKYVSVEGSELDEVTSRSLAGGLALRRAYSKLNVKRAISFHGSIAKAKEFERQQEALSEVYPELDKVDTFHVSSKLSTGQRNEILKEFANAKKGLITNARCLTEGVDIPSVDCVLFADPRKSVIDIIQAAGRAMRTAKWKKYGYIIVPIVVPDNVELDDFAGSTEFKEVISTIRPLAAQDTRITDYLRSVSEGNKPTVGGPIVIDAPVRLTSKIDEGEFSKAIELKVWNKIGKVHWRPFEEARDFVRKLDLRSSTEWKKYCISGALPSDIPAHPALVYISNGWINTGDWIGTGNIGYRYRKYKEYAAARKHVHSQNISSRDEWLKYVQSGSLPSDIPSNPQSTYRNGGWKNWGHWLGTGTVASFNKNYRAFISARKYARGLKLKTAKEWKKLSKSKSLPLDIPATPDRIYKDKGWKDWADWLDSDAALSLKREFKKYVQARNFARSLGLKNGKEWVRYIKAHNLPNDIPKSPNGVYKDSGWIDWDDWLGTSNVRNTNRSFRSFKKARAYVRSLGLQNQMDWRRYIKTGSLPLDIPRSPYRVYEDDGWISIQDWLGTKNISSRTVKYLPFENARDIARGLGISTGSEWSRTSKAGKLPNGLPAAPFHYYRNKGWISWSNWLGT
jgi:superfamily II DNA or RNA helicase